MLVYYCDRCGDDVMYHNENGCMMAGCKCKTPGTTYEEDLNE